MLINLEKVIETESQNYVILMVESIRHYGVVTWGTQATVDYKYKIDEKHLGTIVKYYLDWFSKTGVKLNEAQKKTLTDIANDKMPGSDVEIVLEGHTLAKEIERLQMEEEIDKVTVGKPVIAIGGSPCISATKAYILAETCSTARVVYAGTFPKSVQDFVKAKMNHMDGLFCTGVKNNCMPGTISFESGKFKLMLANSEGRDLHNMKINGEFCIDTDYINSVAGEGPVAYAIGGLNKGEPHEYISLINWIKSRDADAIIFVGTNSFKKQIENKDYKTLRAYVEVVRNADIVSMNEAELDQLHESLYNSKNIIGRSEKLAQLNLSGINIVHSAEGAIAHCGTSICLNKTKKRIIEGILQMAVDGASRLYETGLDLNTLSDSVDYALSVKDRRNDNGLSASLNYSSALNYIVGAAAPYINDAKGNITGIGAVFDGYLMALITPCYRYIKN